MQKLQSPTHLFMIEPEEFYNNLQTLDSNDYQVLDKDVNKDDILKKAKLEFVNFKNTIESSGIKVTYMHGSLGCPDHIFPNWFATFQDKTMQIFSMKALNRRAEKKPDMIKKLQTEYKLTEDMTHYEEKGIFLESTSSMVFDRVNMIAYIGKSVRTNANLAKEWCSKNGFELILFETTNHKNNSIYHTDVLMFVGTEMIGLCVDVINEDYKDMVYSKATNHHEVMLITKEQILDFCGNALEARNDNNEKFLIMSTRAHNSLSTDQHKCINRFYKKIIHSDISTIERYGGGSARCMLTELF